MAPTAQGSCTIRQIIKRRQNLPHKRKQQTVLVGIFLHNHMRPGYSQRNSNSHYAQVIAQISVDNPVGYLLKAMHIKASRLLRNFLHSAAQEVAQFSP